MSMNTQKGIALVEVVIGAALIASSFVAIIGVYASLATISNRSLPRVQAAMIAEEGIEATRSLRDTSYASRLASLTNGTSYYLNWSTASSSYALTTTPAAIDSTFYRTVSVANAYRNSSYNLVSSGTLDTDTKLVTVTVAWNENNATSTYVLQTYLSDIFNN
jgi:Tfp pilus assembly protein PilV